MNNFDRRAFLHTGLTLSAAVSAAGITAACTTRAAGPRWILPTDPQVQAAETARRVFGRARSLTLAAVAGPVDLGGKTVATWTYGGILPGREIRVRTGEVIQARLVNQLPADTTIHWHGLALRNDMDGVPNLTQAAIAPGAAFTYRFSAAQPGTYWFHPHTGVHLDRGLYAPLIVEDPDEPAAYDHDWTMVLDDWIDGTGYTPDQVLAMLKNGVGGMPMGGPMNGTAEQGPTLRGATSPLLGGHAGDVNYPHYLVNGRLATAPRTFTANPGSAHASGSSTPPATPPSGSPSADTACASPTPTVSPSSRSRSTQC